ncbi:hypothetical protein EON65_48740 [archaeon]|nr:MAG: hypothetical protein EON65_48740 [archaeon]
MSSFGEVPQAIDVLAAEISTEISFGKYVWCGNIESATGSGFTLTNQSIRDGYGDTDTYMLSIVVTMNEPLAQRADSIEVFTPWGGLFGYNSRRLRGPTYQFFSKFKPTEVGMELRVVVGGYQVVSDEVRKERSKRLMRPLKKTLFEQMIVIPDLPALSDTTCSICLSNVETDTNKYITSCKHVFHMRCIWDYLRHTDCLSAVHPRCTQLYPSGQHGCCNSAKLIKSFQCPNCKLTIRK